MEVSREYLLELDNKRKKIEEEILAITNFLNSDGMPGVDGKLIDNQGFPLPNIDHIAVRTARNKLIHLQNDLKNLMETIETNMAIYFNNQKLNKKVEEKKQEIDLKEPIQLQVFEEDFTKKQGDKLKIPLATVGFVSEGSPAEEAGLMIEDGIVNFDNIVYYGAFTNPLQKIAEIVGRKIENSISVEIVRKVIDENGIEKKEYKTLNLVPHKWSGQGVLG